MQPKVCKRCGKTFEPASKYKYLCPACAKESRRTSAIRPRTCTICGAVFDGGPKALYCPTCRAEVNRERDRIYHRQGAARHIGDKDLCTVCGAEYVIRSGLQRYCDACAASAVRESDRKQGAEYYSSNADTINSKRNALRSNARICYICGKAYYSSTATATCSPECDRKRILRNDASARLRANPNLRPQASNGVPKSGVTGITWHKQSSRWQVKVHGHYVGIYDDLESAKKAQREYIEGHAEDDNIR